MKQTKGDAKDSRDSKGWRLVWPINSLAQEDTPDESAAEKKKSLELINSVVAS